MFKYTEILTYVKDLDDSGLIKAYLLYFGDWVFNTIKMQ